MKSCVKGALWEEKAMPKLSPDVIALQPGERLGFWVVGGLPLAGVLSLEGLWNLGGVPLLLWHLDRSSRPKLPPLPPLPLANHIVLRLL